MRESLNVISSGHSWNDHVESELARLGLPKAHRRRMLDVEFGDVRAFVKFLRNNSAHIREQLFQSDLPARFRSVFSDDQALVQLFDLLLPSWRTSLNYACSDTFGRPSVDFLVNFRSI